jgi:hypothetical protein
MNHLFCFGFGLTARTLCSQLDRRHWRVSATSRSAEGCAAIRAAGAEALSFTALAALPGHVTHLLMSAPPGDGGDPVLAALGDSIAARARDIAWAGYLSTTGVYGDHAGGWISEDTQASPLTSRGARRLAAENAWLSLWRDRGLPIHIFRLAGIYGPGRNALEGLLSGTAKHIVKEGQVFSRIHAADIAGILQASMAKPHPGRIYNCADDLPTPPGEVIVHAACLLGLEPPPAQSPEQAGLSAMALSFYGESKRVANRRVKTELGYRFLYPTYREGLAALHAAPAAG